MLKFSIPCVLSMLVGALYNIVDQIFIGNALSGNAFENTDLCNGESNHLQNLPGLPSLITVSASSLSSQNCCDNCSVLMTRSVSSDLITPTTAWWSTFREAAKS